MYLVTGGAGFIGSNLVARLAARGAAVAVCDWLGHDERWRNLAHHELAAVVAPEALAQWLARPPAPLQAVLHMGAISTTTETDVERLAHWNIRSTLELLQWCTEHQVRFIYASSAATYGDGSAGFDDDGRCEALATLRPLNAYGWSKHVVDRRIARLVREAAPLPPQWVGLKFFNVYGPNEYHKGSMQSVIARNFARARTGEALQLFRSYRSDYADGGQLRDFIYVRDCIDVMEWLLGEPRVSGLFNVGTGQARSWLDLAAALFAACDRPCNVQFIDMPETLQSRYQYFTEARMQRLREAGYHRPFTSLEAGVTDYVSRHLSAADPYL
ncbi:MAG TPA: ADP-glyceromanno-heptose 6-epimerase [Steroidobacteraceae bacterium]|nr:ADP-glyceromanno-heptose 6-epimerase [Steroidobacteraceae bacterium]